MKNEHRGPHPVKLLLESSEGRLTLRLRERSWNRILHPSSPVDLGSRLFGAAEMMDRWTQLKPRLEF